MNIYLIVLIFALDPVFGSDVSSSEYYDPEEDNGAYMIKMLFLKLNTILEENAEIRKELVFINERLKGRDESVRIIMEEVIQQQNDFLDLKYQNLTERLDDRDRSCRIIVVEAIQNQNAFLDQKFINLTERLDGRDKSFRIITEEAIQQQNDFLDLKYRNLTERLYDRDESFRKVVNESIQQQNEYLNFKFINLTEWLDDIDRSVRLIVAESRHNQSDFLDLKFLNLTERLDIMDKSNRIILEEAIQQQNDFLDLKYRNLTERLDNIYKSSRKIMEETLQKQNDFLDQKFLNLTERLDDRDISVWIVVEEALEKRNDFIDLKFLNLTQRIVEEALQRRNDFFDEIFSNLTERLDDKHKSVRIIVEEALKKRNELLDLQFINLTERLYYHSQTLANVTSVLKKILKRQEKVNKHLNENDHSTNATMKEFSSNLPSLNRNWTVIQRRLDGSEDFYRNWTQYQTGFGNIEAEFFIGLQKLHEITTYGPPQELLIIMKDFENQTRYAKYDSFVIGSEAEKYAIKQLGSYNGDAGDALTQHRGAKFSTKDQDNDRDEFGDCAREYKGAWWFHNCYESHLNGPYLDNSNTTVGGINWSHWHGYKYSLKFVEMLIRAKT